MRRRRSRSSDRCSTGVLERLAAATAGKPTAVLLIPAQRDFERRAVSGPAPLSRRLADLTAELGLHLVDLIEPMAKHTRDTRAYFHACDFHWSAHGNRVASQIAHRQLGGILYASQSEGNRRTLDLE